MSEETTVVTDFDAYMGFQKIYLMQQMTLLSDIQEKQVNLNGKIFYSDVTWDAGRFQRNKPRKYFLLSKKDMSIDHKLTDEQHVIDYGISISMAEQYELLKFAQDRIRSADLDFKNTQNRMFK